MTKQQIDNIAKIALMADCIKLIAKMSDESGMTYEEIAAVMADMAKRMYGKKS